MPCQLSYLRIFLCLLFQLLPSHLVHILSQPLLPQFLDFLIIPHLNTQNNNARYQDNNNNDLIDRLNKLEAELNKIKRANI